MNFIRNNGEVVQVNDKDVSKLEETESYTLFGARHNPSGEQMTSVVYKNGHTPGDMHNADNDTGLVLAPSEEESREMEPMTEVPALKNPRQRITWKNLRLSSSIAGQKAVRGKLATAAALPSLAVRQLTAMVFSGELDAETSIRDSPILFMARAEDWYQYITNMNSVDIGSEFAAGVSHAQRAGNALFAAEWQADPSHQNLAGRLMPGGDYDDAVKKGQIAYDVLTRGRDILTQQGYGANNEEIMHRLVADIIRSMPIKQYNFYNLYNLHMDEGDKIYREFQSRYIPLDTAEVEMVLEMQRALDAEGDAYAFRTTTNEEQGVLSAKLMRSAVADYEVGDTMSVRTILRTLRDPPYNYRPRAVVISSASDGDTNLRAGEMKTSNYLELEVVNKDIISEMVDKGVGRKISDKKVGVWVLGVKPQDIDPKNANKLVNNHGYKTLQIAFSQADPTPQYVAVPAAKGKQGKQGGNRWTIVDYTEDFLKAGNQDPGKKAQSIRRGLGGGDNKKKPRNNPKGRGKLHYIELWGKNQIDMKRREPAKGKQKGETRHGSGKSKKGQTYWTKGVNKSLPEYQMLQMGVLKRTGEEAPYRIRLPTSHFAIRFHEGVGYKTLMPKKDKANKAFIKAYEDFLKFYGFPKHMPSKDTHNRFVIPKEERMQSEYYQDVRKRAGKK